MNPDVDIERLAAEGFIVELREGHVLLHDIPYINSEGRIRRGVLVTEYQPIPIAGEFRHPAWFKGEMPCGMDAKPIVGIGGADAKAMRGIGIEVDRMFSTRPATRCYTGHHEQLHRYVDLISLPASALDPKALPYLPAPQEIMVHDDNSVFAYDDAASVRYSIQAANERFKGQYIGIIGIGGTGSYILDLVAKTCVAEIHLFDGDVFCHHNAFRAPGVAKKEEVDALPPKASFFACRYSAFRKGIIPHDHNVTRENVGDLDLLDFVFISVDDGPSRGLIVEHLLQHTIPFIDVGMGLDQNEMYRIHGQCRITYWRPGEPIPEVPTSPRSDHDLYRTAIQTADTNVLSASLAVMRWKRHAAFYHNAGDESEILVNVSRCSVCRS